MNVFDVEAEMYIFAVDDVVSGYIFGIENEGGSSRIILEKFLKLFACEGKIFIRVKIPFFFFFFVILFRILFVENAVLFVAKSG